MQGSSEAQARLLVVEDDMFMLQAMKSMLELVVDTPSARREESASRHGTR